MYVFASRGRPSLAERWLEPPMSGFPEPQWDAVLASDPNYMRAEELAPGFTRYVIHAGTDRRGAAPAAAAAAPAHYPSSSPSPELTAYVVERPEHVAPALELLKSTMRDGVVAIDLEWRPDGFMPPLGGHPDPSKPAPPSRVALIQLASATVAVLLRASHLGPELPEALATFLRDPRHTLLGCGWDTCDEGKMRGMYGRGAEELFGGGGCAGAGAGGGNPTGGKGAAPPDFLDLQVIAERLGYAKVGLSGLAAAVLGAAPPSNKAVTLSNWESRAPLSRAQVKYAALDALMAGSMYRVLRLWEASGKACAACRLPLGGWASPAVLCAGWCGGVFADARAYLAHCAKHKHEVTVHTCSGCGRVVDK